MHSRLGRAALATMAGATAVLAGCTNPPDTTPPPTPPPVADPTRDCIPYNPANLEIRDEGASGWLLTDGRSRMVMLDNRNDAEQALALAGQGDKQCFIGRGNTRPNRVSYIVEAWAVSRPPLDPLPRSEDCIPYNPATLSIRDEGASGWLLTDGASRMAILDNRNDAEEALTLARRHRQQCFIGRDNTRPDRLSYIVDYWR